MATPALNSHCDRPSGLTIRRIDGNIDLLALHAAQSARYPFLLQSVAHGTPQARYDILFAFPGETLQLDGLHTLTRRDCKLESTDFLHALDAWWAQETTPARGDAALPFQGGWFLYLGYELATQIEPRLQFRACDPSLPTAFATRIPAAVIRDHTDDSLWLVAENQVLLEHMVTDLHAPPADMPRTVLPVMSVEEDAPERYLDGVPRVQRYIVEGDVFQVNLSRAWRAHCAAPHSAVDLYARLCRHNPAPFAGLVRHHDKAIISSSPERLVRVCAGVAETRPIAGTRPRSDETQRDVDYSRELLAHPKERAEHVMLIDLERNDLGRVCVPGTVTVDELMVLESYAHVHHIVSNVRGQLRPEVTPGQVIRAVFPGGTITGCPKVRCMEIIAELEQTHRGAYTGSMGYLNRNGDMDLNILIRTMVSDGVNITLRAGAGIVADSQAEAELAETRAKAHGLLLALSEQT